MKKYTHTQVAGFVKKASDYTKSLDKNPFLSSIDIDRIINDTGGLLEDALLSLAIPSIATANKTTDVQCTLNKFIGKYEGQTLTIERVSELMTKYSELVAFTIETKSVTLTDKEQEWFGNNNIIPYKSGDCFADAKYLPLTKILNEYSESLGGFLEDEMIVETIAGLTKDVNSYLLSYSIKNLMYYEGVINNETLKAFQKITIENVKDGEVKVHYELLDKIEIGLDKTIRPLIEFINVFKEKIKEKSAQ